MNNKGFIEGAMYYIIFAFVFSFVLVFLIIIIDQWNAGIQSSNSSAIPDEAKVTSQDYTTSLRRADIGLGYLLIGFVIVSVIVARFKDEVQPVWIVIGVISLMVIGFIGMILENIWGGFNDQAMINAVTSELIFIPFLMNHFIGVLIAYVALVVVARMTRSGGGFGA